MKRFISLLLCSAMCMGLSIGVFAENKSSDSYIYEDYDASDYNWISTDLGDSDYGKVYIFESYGYSEGMELFSDEFEDGTYVVSLDFKIDGTMSEGIQAKIEILSESGKDMTGFYMQDNGDAYIEVRDYSGRKLIPTMVKSENDWSEWNNYEVVYEKEGTDVSVLQYLNGDLLHEAVVIEDNFRLKQFAITHPESDDFSANLYIDNITCKLIGTDAGEDDGEGEEGEEPSQPPQIQTEVVYEDSDASKDSAWTKLENYDELYGNVYEFEAGKSCDGTIRFTEEFEDGTYVVSMDFMTENYPSGENQIQILVNSETWDDRVTLALRKDGILGYTLSDAGALRLPFSYKYGTNYKPGEWSNYSIVYEKTGTEVITTQYINGTKIHNGVTLYDNFRFRRITITTPSDASLYLDNVSVTKVDGVPDFEIVSKDAVDGALKVTFNKVPMYKSLTQARVIDSKGKTITVTDYSFEAMTLTLKNPNIIEGEEYTVNFNSSFSDTIGNIIIQENDDTTGGGSEMTEESDLSMYGVIASSAGETQVFVKDATVTYDGERHKNILNLISDKEETLGLKPEFKEKLGLERVAISFDFKVGPNSYINSVALEGSKLSVRIKRSGHEADHFINGGEYVEGLTGGALIKRIPWPEDGAWTNVCYVNTPSGVELYLNNEFFAKSPYFIGDVLDVIAQFKANGYSHMDNFRIVNLDDCVFTAKTKGIEAYENDNMETELCLAFTTPVEKSSLNSIVITDENGEIVQTGKIEFSGTNVYIELPEGEPGATYNAAINEPTGIGQLKYVELSETPSVMSTSFEDCFGNKTSYSPKLPAFLTSVSVMLSGVFEEDALKSAISITTDGKEIPFDITVREDEKYGVTVADCHFTKRLSPETSYELSVSGSLKSKDKDEALGEETTYLFKTSDCESLKLLSGVKDGKVSDKVSFYKKSNDANVFLQGALKKSTVTMMVDGVEREVEYLEDLHTDIKVTDTNFEGEVEMPDVSRYGGYSYFLWTWPKMGKISSSDLLIKEENEGSELSSTSVYNLVTTFYGDAGTTRGFAWSADKEYTDMAIRYIQEDGKWTESEITDAVYTEYNGRLHYKADIDNLIPGETYKYKIGDKEDNLWSEGYTFTTQPENLTEFSFIGVTDPQSDSWAGGFEYYKATLDKAFADDNDAAFMVNLGDMVNDGTRIEQWDCYFEAVKGYAESIPHMAVVGNHETRGDASTAVKNFTLMFNNPKNGADAFGGLTELDVSNSCSKGVVNNFEGTAYSFDYGNAHFAVLNSGTDWSESDHTKIMTKQAEWLEEDLKNASDKKWKIVMVHISMYPAKVERYDSRDELTEVIDKYGVDLVLSGHDHMITRTYPMKNKQIVETSNPASVTKGTGMINAILGAAGPKRYDAIEVKPDYLAVLNATSYKQPVYSVFSVNDDKITVITRQLDGTVNDSYEIIENK